MFLERIDQGRDTEAPFKNGGLGMNYDKLINQMVKSEDRSCDEQPDSFEHLLCEARKGGQEALSRLLARYRKYLLLIANEDFDRRLQAKFGASDVVQNSLIHASEHFRQFRGGTENEFKGWIKAILKNDLGKEVRQYTALKRNAHREILIADNNDRVGGIADQQRTPSSEAIKRERFNALAAALKRLSPLQRAVIELRNFEKLGFAEIGRQLERSEDAARKLWARSIETLKDQLKDDAPGLMDESYQLDQP